MESEFLTVPPCKMKKEFTAKEIEKLASKLNTDKAPGPDNLKAEYIKNAPLSTHQQIADIYNTTAATGDTPTAMVHGLLHPVQKPGKKKGPPDNLRPIILLSILRKIHYDSATGQDLGAASHKDTKISSGLPEGEEHHRTSVSIEDFNR